MPTKKKIDWDNQPFGEMSDNKLGELLDVSYSTVAHQRRKRGIPPKHPQKKKVQADWDNLPLGEVHDTEIAEQLGCSVHTVANARKARGIPTKRYRGNPTKVDWDSLPLGKVSDRIIAEHFGMDVHTVGIHTVGIHRRKRGILLKKGGKKKYQDIDWDSLPLGEVPDKDIAIELGVSPTVVGRMRRERGIIFPRGRPLGPNPPPPGLGEIPDQVLAEQLGVTKQRIHQIRQRHGIPSYREFRRKKKDKDTEAQQRRYDWSKVPLGEFSDRILASVYGVAPITVGNARKRRNIPKCPYSLAEQLERLLRALTEDFRFSSRPNGIPILVKPEKETGTE